MNDIDRFSKRAWIKYRWPGISQMAVSVLALSIGQYGTAQDNKLSISADQKSITYTVNSEGILAPQVNLKRHNTTVEGSVIGSVSKNNSVPITQSTSDVERQLQILRAENEKLQLLVTQYGNRIDQLESLLETRSPAVAPSVKIIPTMPVKLAKVNHDSAVVKRNSKGSAMSGSGQAPLAGTSRVRNSMESIGSEEQTAALKGSAAHLHHVVYIFKNKAGQQRMWESLGLNQEDERWQGVNSNQSRFFIYVGAFQTQLQAQERAVALSVKIGVKPIVYSEKR